MFIKDMFSDKRPVISFEVFPPKREYPIDTIYSTIESLKDLNPDFISVTYGAGGSGENRTVELVSTIKNKYNIEPLTHLTCITSTKQKTKYILDELKRNNIDNILALRGDLPKDNNFNPADPPHYRYGKDLVLDICQRGGFCTGGACYPEGHIDCADPETDLMHLMEKVKCGTDFLITQLFFDNETFYKFKENAARSGINVPILAGIMPVLNKKQIEHIVSLCGSHIPDKFKRILDKYEHKPEALKEAGAAYATEQIIDLLSWGVDGVHIYTMNRPDITAKIMGNIASIRKALI